MFRLQALVLILLPWPAQAVILFSGDNSANLTAPDIAREDVFNSVARVCNATGTLNNGYGSAVRIRGKYLLTANHVNSSGAGHVTFDGVTVYPLDAAFGKRRIGTADLALIKLVDDPGFNEVKLFDAVEGDIPRFFRGSTIYSTATIIGVGRGRSPGDTDGDAIWSWGDNSTMVKRWGTNRIERAVGFTPDNQPYDADYQGLETTLDGSAGNDEAATTIYDSGCGLFVEHNGEWKLAGIATLVSNSGSSTFGGPTPDSNYFVRINQLATAIEAIITGDIAYSGWKVDHSLYGANANDGADTDGDGIPQLLEYALGGDPNHPSRVILPVQQMTEDGGSQYLELVVTRPIGLQGLSFIPQTDTTLTSWPVDSTGIADPSPTPADNGDGTETLIYRRSEDLSANPRAFMRLKIQWN